MSAKVKKHATLMASLPVKGKAHTQALGPSGAAEKPASVAKVALGGTYSKSGPLSVLWQAYLDAYRDGRVSTNAVVLTFSPELADAFYALHSLVGAERTSPMSEKRTSTARYRDPAFVAEVKRLTSERGLSVNATARHMKVSRQMVRDALNHPATKTELAVMQEIVKMLRAPKK